MQFADEASMSQPRLFIRVMLFTALNLTIAVAFAAPRNTSSQAMASEAAPRVQSAVDAASRVVLHGNIHPLSQAATGHAGRSQSIPAQSAQSASGTDLGAVEDSLPA